MGDNNPMHGGHTPPVRLRTPGEELWRLLRDQVVWTCEMRYHAAFGVEAQVLRDGDLVIARTYPFNESLRLLRGSLNLELADVMFQQQGDR